MSALSSANAAAAQQILGHRSAVGRSTPRPAEGGTENAWILNHRVVDAAEGVPHSATYVKRFGSMKRAYRLAGFSGDPQLGDGKRSPEARRAITSVLSNAQMLSAARRALKKHGKLTRKTIDTSGESRSSTTYLDRFGSMERVYRLIGYRPGVRQQSCIRTRGLSNEQMLEFVA